MPKPTSMSCEAYFFTAPWCDPCHQAAPIFSEAARELNLPASIIDVDLAPDLADRFGVESLPAIVVATHDQRHGILVGSRPKAEVRAFLQSIIGEVSPSEPGAVAD